MNTRSRAGGADRSLATGFRAFRIESVLLSPGTAGLMAATALSSVGVFAAARLGFLLPGAWLWPASIGAAATALKLLFDLLDRSGDPALWRQFLADRFGESTPPDPEIERLCLRVIDLRCRLAEAEIRAGHQGRALVAQPMAALDGWIEGIARLADRLRELRVERAFQQELAESSRRRLTRIDAEQAEARDPELMRQLAATAQGVGQQILAATRFCEAADGAMLKLEHAVAAFGTVGSQLLLVLSRGAELGDGESVVDRIGLEVSALDGLLDALDSVLRPPDGDGAGANDAGSAADPPPPPRSVLASQPRPVPRKRAARSQGD